MSDDAKKFYVHYIVHHSGVPTKLVAGPYDEDEVIARRQDIAVYSYVSNCFVSEDATP